MTGFRVSNIYMSVRKTAISRAPLKRTARSETAHHHSHHSLDTCAAADGVFHKRLQLLEEGIDVLLAWASDSRWLPLGCPYTTAV